MQEGSTIIKHLVKIFGTEQHPSDINTLIRFFDTADKNDDVDEITSDTHVRIPITEEMSVHEDAKRDSPFYKFFCQIKDDVLKQTKFSLK